jgi:3-deoxy-D-manno-octulosonic-acid transferase
LAYPLYRLATGAISPFIPGLLNSRARKGKEDPARLGERLGKASRPRPEGTLVWLHGASVGETLSMLPLVERIRAERPDATLLVTSGTATSAALLAERLPAGAIHQYVPVDTPAAARRFLDHWKPDLVVFVESELWPNLLLGAKARGAKLALVSARITQHSARGWKRFGALARRLLGAFDLILPQDGLSGERLKAIGGRVDGYANLKLTGAPLACDPAELAALRAAAGERKIVLAASTHPHEELLINSAVEVGGRQPLLVIVPRHPVRGPALAEALRAGGRTLAQRSATEPLTAETEIYLADTLGEMGLFFSLADVVVMGGSFYPDIGGHNPLEPARLGKPVIYGDHVFNWVDVYMAIGAGGIRCESEEDLIAAIDRLLDNDGARELMGRCALAAAQVEDGVLDRVWAQLEPLL